MNELINEIDWNRKAEQYHAVYDGKSDKEQLIITQMTLAWSEAVHLRNLYLRLMREYGAEGGVMPRPVTLECASYAEHALAHWRILTELLSMSIEGVAEAMEREGARLRAIGWIAPTRACILDYHTLVKLARR